jgi:hypothetical protein
MMRALFLLLLGTLAFAGGLSGCTREQPVVTGAIRPPMWMVEKPGGGRLILFGAIHQLPADLDWQRGRVALAEQQADALLLELSPDELPRVPADFARISVDEPVPPLDRRLDPQTADKVRDLAEQGGIAEEDIDRTESWALSLAVGNALTQRSGLSVENGVESRLTAAFRAAGKPVDGLESAASQLALFDDLPPATQDLLLKQGIIRADAARERAHEVVRAWAHGDIDALARYAESELAATPGLADPLLHNRNRAWADALALRLDRPGTTLVAVGVGHLVGPGSVVELLRQRGFTVERIQ